MLCIHACESLTDSWSGDPRYGAHLSVYRPSNHLSCAEWVGSKKCVCHLAICCMTILSLLIQIKIAHTSHSLMLSFPTPFCFLIFFFLVWQDFAI